MRKGVFTVVSTISHVVYWWLLLASALLRTTALSRRIHSGSRFAPDEVGTNGCRGKDEGEPGGSAVKGCAVPEEGGRSWKDTTLFRGESCDPMRLPQGDGGTASAPSSRGEMCLSCA